MYLIQTVRILALMGLSFLTALFLTPVLSKYLNKYKLGKQIRISKETPIYSRLHSGKEGTPTMGGIIIWFTVLGLILLLFLLSFFFDGFFGNLNLLDRAQTYLPVAAMLIAALLGMIDDVLGVMRIGPNGGGLKIRHKLIIYTVIAALGAWWFYYKL
ncbi:MAG: hypothetical protein NTW60_02595, partial [Candidatus Wolfebacteria bacterium]|nr:hypothetical protein [Candidatus Wolfebacteria bacterium]